MTSSNRRLPASVALGALAAGLLAACSAGQIAQTSQIVSAVPGAQGQIEVKPPTELIYLRNATLDYPGVGGYAQGATAPLSLWIVNGTTQTVTLTAATATIGDKAATVTQIHGLNSGSPCSVPQSLAPLVPSSTAPSSAVPSSTAPSAGTSPSGKTSPSAGKSASGSVSPSPVEPSPSPSNTGSPTINVPIPAGGCVELDRTSAQYLQIVTLPGKVANGGTVPVTFTFTGADRATYVSQPLDLPVTVPASPNPR